MCQCARDCSGQRNKEIADALVLSIALALRTAIVSFFPHGCCLPVALLTAIRQLVKLGAFVIKYGDWIFLMSETNEKT